MISFSKDQLEHIKNITYPLLLLQKCTLKERGENLILELNTVFSDEYHSAIIEDTRLKIKFFHITISIYFNHHNFFIRIQHINFKLNFITNLFLFKQISIFIFD